MMQINDFQKAITDKHIILDSNILIKAFQNKECFKEFFIFLKKSNCSIANSELVNFEFTRNDYEPDHINQKQQFLSNINALMLTIKSDLLEEALKIAKIYSHQGVRDGKISLVDCCLGALLKQYGEKLFLATINHSDFPTCLFDLEYIFPVDTNKDVFLVAFYRFNNEKWKKLEGKLKKLELSQKKD